MKTVAYTLNYQYVYSALGKYSDPLTLQPYSKMDSIIFSPNLSTNNTHNDIAKQVFRNVCKFIKNKNFNITFTLVFRPFTQYLVEAPLEVITDSSLLGYDAKSLAYQYFR